MAYHFNNRIKVYKEESSELYPDDFEEVEIAKPWADIKTMKDSKYLF